MWSASHDPACDKGRIEISSGGRHEQAAQLSQIFLNIAESMVLSPSLASLAEIDSISMTISETRLVLNQAFLALSGVK
jgi:hypothetical protein